MPGWYVLGSLGKRQIWYATLYYPEDETQGLIEVELGQEVIRYLLRTTHEVVSTHTSSSSVTSEPLLLAVGMQQTMSPYLQVTNEEWENLCMDCGSWEWIDGELDGKVELNGTGKTERNEFGGKSGISTRQITWNWCIGADSSDLL